jgi:uncharacterized protein
MESPLEIRAHTLLCLQGYNGVGYSPEFTARMDRVFELLKEHPETKVRVVVGSDFFCAICPHMENGRCRVDGDEDRSVEMDLLVLDKLGIEANSVQVWEGLAFKLRHSINFEDLVCICGECRWKLSGVCILQF